MDLSGYFLTVAGGAALGIIADILTDAFSKGTRGIDKYINFGVTLCIASCMIIPLIRLFGSGTDIGFDGHFVKDIESAYSDTDSLYILECECEEKLSEKLYTELGIKTADISIEIKMQDGTPSISSAVITLAPYDADKKTSVLEIVSAALGKSEEITINTDGTHRENDRP